jgi:hypothetical protein
MALTAGTRLGAYEILSLLGVGGMGEVHRAKDTHPGGAVAINKAGSKLGFYPQ